MRQPFKNAPRCSFFCPPQRTEKRRSTSSSRMYLFIQLIALNEDFRKYSATGRDFYPQALDPPDMEKRLVAREIIVNFSKDAVQVSNSNLVKSGNAKINPDEQISWIGKSGKREQDRFKFMY